MAMDDVPFSFLISLFLASYFLDDCTISRYWKRAPLLKREDDVIYADPPFVSASLDIVIVSGFIHNLNRGLKT